MKKADTPSEATPVENVVPWVGTIAPPPHYDRIHGPAFTYTLSQPTRPGALDFKRVASVGYSC